MDKNLGHLSFLYRFLKRARCRGVRLKLDRAAHSIGLPRCFPSTSVVDRHSCGTVGTTMFHWVFVAVSALAVASAMEVQVDLAHDDKLLAHLENTAADHELVMLQTKASAEAQRVQGYCEICIRMVQMKQRFQPDVCSGLTDNFFITVSLQLVVCQ